MNTRDLQYFVALVKFKNYTQVAKQFQVSQPTQAIQRLEREFGAQLVRKDRVHRDEMITRSGRLLYANAQLINEKIELTHKEIRRANQKQIRFGMPPIIGRLYISKIVSEFSKDLLSRLKITSVGSHGPDQRTGGIRGPDFGPALWSYRQHQESPGPAR